MHSCCTAHTDARTARTATCQAGTTQPDSEGEAKESGGRDQDADRHHDSEEGGRQEREAANQTRRQAENRGGIVPTRHEAQSDRRDGDDESAAQRGDVGRTLRCGDDTHGALEQPEPQRQQRRRGGGRGRGTRTDASQQPPESRRLLTPSQQPAPSAARMRRLLRPPLVIRPSRPACDTN